MIAAEEGAHECDACSPGKYSELHVRCDDCRPGEYANHTGANACHQCEDGYVSGFGAVTCDACPAGKQWDADPAVYAPKIMCGSHTSNWDDVAGNSRASRSVRRAAPWCVVCVACMLARACCAVRVRVRVMRRPARQAGSPGRSGNSAMLCSALRGSALL